jgi:hypothetical protein
MSTGTISSADGNRTYVKLDSINATYVRLDNANTFTAVNTNNQNITMNSNLTFNNVQNGITFNTANRIFDNGTCLLIIGRTSRIEVC